MFTECIIILTFEVDTVLRMPRHARAVVRQQIVDHAEKLKVHPQHAHILPSNTVQIKSNQYKIMMIIEAIAG
jgi:hypothetical protein